MLNAGDGGQPRPRAHSDEDVLRRVGSIAHLWLSVLAAVVTKNTIIVRRWQHVAAAYLDGVGIDEGGTTLNELDARAGKQVLVDAVETIDLLVLVVDELLPIEALHINRPTEVARILKIT